MTFTTFTFFLFLVTVFTSYWSVQRWLWLQNLVILIASYVFYGWWDWRFCALLAASSTMEFCAALCIDNSGSKVARRTWLIVSLAFNMGILGFFKYCNFFVDSLAGVADALGWRVPHFTLHILLPVGISFYTFQGASYIIDVYRREASATRRYFDYMAYVAFFPQLLAGPIMRSVKLLPQILSPRRFDYGLACSGCRQMLYGFFKKMVIADNLAPIVDFAYADPAVMSGPQLMFATVLFALQIYCDFSAYSDIAIGTARLFGIEFIRNFAYPYFSQSVAEFWRRWHISLSTWFRDYVFVPLGGSRVSPLRHVVNIMVTFVISGLWHGASWNYIIWGAINGAGMVPFILRRRSTGLGPDDTVGGESLIPSPKAAFRMLATFAFICFGWIFFRAHTLADAFQILCNITSDIFRPKAYSGMWLLLSQTPLKTAILGQLGVFLLMEWLNRRHAVTLHLTGWPRWARWVCYTVVIMNVLYFGTYSHGEFIYFQF